MRLLLTLATTFGLIHTAEACPSAPRSAPGWEVRAYGLKDLGARGNSLMGGNVLEAGSFTTMPRRFAGLPGIRPAAEPVQLVFESQFRACTAGTYSFSLVIQAGQKFGESQESDYACWGDMFQGTTKLFSVTEGLDLPAIFPAGPGGQLSWSGTVSLTEGLHPLRVRLACGSAGGGVPWRGVGFHH